MHPIEQASHAPDDKNHPAVQLLHWLLVQLSQLLGQQEPSVVRLYPLAHAEHIFEAHVKH